MTSRTRDNLESYFVQRQDDVKILTMLVPQATTQSSSTTPKHFAPDLQYTH